MSSAGRETVHVEVDGERRLIGRSPPPQRVFRQIQQVAPADVSVLITGETATGKELVARLAHEPGRWRVRGPGSGQPQG